MYELSIERIKRLLQMAYFDLFIALSSLCSKLQVIVCHELGMSSKSN